MPLPTADQFMTHALRSQPGGRMLAEIAAAALQAADPAAAVRRYVRRDGPALLVGERRMELAAGGRWLVVGAGKAAAAMAGALAEIAGDLLAAGLVIVKDGHAAQEACGPIAIAEASHPFPDQRGVAAAGEIRRMLAAATAEDGVLVALSGGGSALLTLPAAGLSLADLRRGTELLLHAGAPIEDLNLLRRHCEQLKGGGLARLAWPAQIEGLILSDVVGSALHVIASGPISPDPTSPANALELIERYGLSDHLPPAVLAHLRHASAPAQSSPAADDWHRTHATLIGANEDACAAAMAAARTCGLTVYQLEQPLSGPAHIAGHQLGRRLRELAAHAPRPWALIGGGETVVRLDPAQPMALGGRNQELALAAAIELAGLDNLALLALATDGGDGHSPAAGAVATGATIQRACALGLDPAQVLSRHASFAFWHALDDALITGPTGTNVNDVVVGVGW